MNLNKKEAKVIELLKHGKSNTFIQDQLQVSPTKIALLKRMYLPSDDVVCDNSGYDSSSDSAISSAGSATTATAEDNDNSTNYRIVDENKSGYDQSNSINQTKNNMSQNRNYYGKSKVERLNLQLDYKIALKKLALEKETLELKRKELQLKSSALNNEQQKIEREGKALIFRFRKLMRKFKSGTWAFQQINDYYHNAVCLIEAIDEYCIKEDIDIDGLKILSILSGLISNIEVYVNVINECYIEVGLDENDVLISTPTTLEVIVDKFQEIEIDEAQSIGFDDYE